MTVDELIYELHGHRSEGRGSMLVWLDSPDPYLAEVLTTVKVLAGEPSLLVLST